MSAIRPLRGIRPQARLAGRVIAPPYDVPTDAEARAIASGDALSFLHVTRPEVDFPVGSDPHARVAYQHARSVLDGFLADGTLTQDDEPCLYLYVQTWRSHIQAGLIALCAVDEYDRGLIKRHELTRPDKEQDRVDHIEAVSAQTGLVFLTYRDQPAVAQVLHKAAEARVDWMVTTDDGVDHMLQVINDNDAIRRILTAFEGVPALYVADGHHRAAAASRVARARGADADTGWFMAGLFPDSQLTVLSYNRVVTDLGEHSPGSFLSALNADFDVQPTDDPTPSGRGQFTLYLGGAWHLCTARPGVVPDDPVGGLDVSVLQDRVMSGLLGIDDPRRDPRLSFVGGIRGPEALAAAVDSGEAAAAFHMFPTGLDQLFSVADAGQLMPPKSTWFEPKLRGGVVVHRLE